MRFGSQHGGVSVPHPHPAAREHLSTHFGFFGPAKPQNKESWRLDPSSEKIAIWKFERRDKSKIGTLSLLLRVMQVGDGRRPEGAFC